ncbi:protein FANTASTIC FOUR 3-like protein [Corchorus olitorius]|uniref:Protein FANTASTIC FOUR 3-like protein n=1 Tax=Corchorus olitorius TaxID=93759 RepID=A0A1R3IXM2_9ROSI|nr:protein FANTASTIC FOUR 3-like protein [Corchorus olitorius]
MSLIDPQNTDIGGWSMLHYLANANTKNSTDNQVYVHPLVKHSSTKVGNETETEVGEIEMSLLSLETPVSNNVTKLRESLGGRKMIKNFPSPSTTSSNGFQSVSSINAVGYFLKLLECLLAKAFFRAERSEGRLRLSLIKREDNGVYEKQGEE